MKIKALKWMDRDFGTQWRDEIENRWVYDDFKKHDDWRKEWISFDCALYNPEDNRVCDGKRDSVHGAYFFGLYCGTGDLK